MGPLDAPTPLRLNLAVRRGMAPSDLRPGLGYSGGGFWGRGGQGGRGAGSLQSHGAPEQPPTAEREALK